MPFDPRLINPDDAPEDALGEIDLPDDLLELAAQLRDDAVYLSERYPAVHADATNVGTVGVLPVPNPVAFSTRFTHRGILVGLGGISAVVALVIGLNYQLASPTREVALPPAGPINHVAMVESLPNQAEVPVATSAPAAPKPRIERLPWAPQPALGDVTGPELEGLLDLWQNDEHPAETRISI